jgi:hypothetical protein
VRAPGRIDRKGRWSVEKVFGGLIFLLFIAGVAFYVYRSYSGMTQQGVAKHYGLAPGETVRLMWVGEIDLNISLGEHIGRVALGIVAGALLGGAGVASTRPPGVTVLITSHNRLVLVTELPDGKVGKAMFSSPAEVGVQICGPGNRSIQGGPSVVVELSGADRIPCRVLLHESAVGGLHAWCVGQR